MSLTRTSLFPIFLWLVSSSCSSAPGAGPARVTTETMKTEPLSSEVCASLAVRAGACGWSQQATVGCSAALRDESADTVTALEACLGVSACAAAWDCVSDVLLGAVPAPLADAGSTAADGGAVDSGEDATSDDAAPPVVCVNAVPFADASCLACMNRGCCAESTACGGSPACLDLLTCVSRCVGDAGCESACKSVRSTTTIHRLDALRTCRDTTCSARCPSF